MNKIRILAIAYLAMSLTQCNQKQGEVKPQDTPPAVASAPSATPKVPTDVAYEVIRIDKNGGPSQSRDVRIRINKIMSEEAIRAIAVDWRNKSGQEVPRPYLFFYLPGMDPDNAAWATASFDPDLKTRILGSTEEESRQVKLALSPNQRAVGQWIDNAAGHPYRIIVLRDKNRLHMLQIFDDGSKRDFNLVEKHSKLGRRFEDARGSDSGDYYLLMPNGDLQVCDSEGLIDTAKPFH